MLGLFSFATDLEKRALAYLSGSQFATGLASQRTISISPFTSGLK